jgi:hypothetical protein
MVFENKNIFSKKYLKNTPKMTFVPPFGGIEGGNTGG